MRKLLLAVGLLFCLGALAHAEGAAKPAKVATLTFNKAAVVLVNGQPVQSGYQLKKGDKVYVQSGSAQVNGGFWGHSDTLMAGDTMDLSSTGSKTYNGQKVDTVNVTGKDTFSLSFAEGVIAPPPPNPLQNLKVVPVSGSAP